jgi:subfamily B ATP-binding cassette protein MsbA
MNTYFRILRYAPNVTPRLLQFFLYSFIGVVFSASYLGLIMPMMQILFDAHAGEVMPVRPEFTFSLQYVTAMFKYLFTSIIVEHGKSNALLFVCISIVTFVLLANVFRYMERMAASRIKLDIVRNLRMDIFSSVSRLHIGYFNTQRKGDLISRFTNDIGEVEHAVVNSLKSVLKEPITILVYFSVLFFISVKLTLFTLILLPVTGGLVARIIKQLRKKAKQSQEAMGRIVNILDETFSGMRVIKAFNAREFIIKKLDDETRYHRKVNLSIARRNELSGPLSEFLGVIIVAVILFYGGQLILNGDEQLKPEMFMGFLAFFASLIQPAKNFSNGITSLQKGTIAAERIFSVVDTQPAIQNKPGAIPIPSFNEAIEFKGVGFAYHRDLVLKNITVRIEKGKTVALVGQSGGGKSTFADLIPRFYDPTEGEVCLDGHPLTDYELESVRKLIGVVTQESILFNDTIYNNIAFGMPHVQEQDVIEAARVANAHEFIMQTEHGYQTLIGERGSKLSGGQRQRLAIARAVLKNPPILILDEATSALDSESERLVQDALTKLMQNRTSIVIAHRLSTIQHADEILVIQGGHIIERGSHQDLISKEGVYRKLREIQKT